MSKFILIMLVNIVLMSTTISQAHIEQPVSETANETHNPSEGGYELLQNVEIAIPFETAQIYEDDWDYDSEDYPLLSEEKMFSTGVGMYIPAMTIVNMWGQDEITYSLNGMYDKIQFDLLTDTNRTYGEYDDYGLYIIKIYADGYMVYDSKQMYYHSIVDDMVIILPEDTMSLTIQLHQKRGQTGTLDIVFGDFFLYMNDD